MEVMKVENFNESGTASSGIYKWILQVRNFKATTHLLLFFFRFSNQEFIGHFDKSNFHGLVGLKLECRLDWRENTIWENKDNECRELFAEALLRKEGEIKKMAIHTLWTCTWVSTSDISELSVSIWPMLDKAYGTPLQYSCLENPMDGGA